MWVMFPNFNQVIKNYDQAVFDHHQNQSHAVFFLFCFFSYLDILTSFLLLVDWWRTEGGQPTQWGIFWIQLHTDLQGLKENKRYILDAHYNIE